MTRAETWTNGKLREQWNNLSRTYSSWDADGSVVEERPYTDEENTAADQRLHQAQAQADAAATIDAKFDTALAANLAYLDIPSPTAAQAREQTRALTRQMNAAIRYLTGRLDTTAGT